MKYNIHKDNALSAVVRGINICNARFLGIRVLSFTIYQAQYFEKECIKLANQLHSPLLVQLITVNI